MPEIFTLENGLRVVWERMPHLRSVSVGVWVRAGAMLEERQENGLSHFNEHMSFKGTPAYTARELAMRMDMIGGNVNAATSKTLTTYYANVTDENLGEAVSLLSGIVRYPKMDEQDIAREQNVVLEEIRMAQDNYEDVADDLISAATYDGSALAQTVLGEPLLIKNYDRDAILAYRGRHYHPANTVLAVTGQVKREQVHALAQQYFGNWAKAGEASTYPDASPNQRRFLGDDKPSEQTHLCITHPGLAMGSKDAYAMMVLNNILGGSMSSRLFQRIRETSGMAYNVYSAATMYPPCGDLQIYAATAPATARKVVRQIEQERRKLLKSGVTMEELTQGKTQIKTGYVLAQESAYHRMSSLGSGLLVRNRIRTPSAILKGIDKVTMDDVMRVAHNSLGQPCNMTAVGRRADQFVEWAKKEIYGG